MDLTARLLTVIIVFLCLAPAISEAQKLKTFSNQYGPFNDSHLSIFEVVNPAVIHLNAFQLTPDSAGDVDLRHKSGRILLKQIFKLWDGDNIINSTSRRVASFNSSFLINIYPKGGPPGEGLAFLIAPDLKLPPNSSGQYLGLTNSTTNDQPTNRLVAVEFDTVKQDFDPDSNHIGLDINSVTSKVNVSLTPLGIELAPELSPPNAKFYNVWVDYDGINKTIQVYIAEQLIDSDPTPPKPNTPVLTSDLDLRAVVNQYSYFGFSASTGNLTELNCVLRWNLTVEYFEDKIKNPGLTIWLAAGIPSLVVVVLAAAGLGYYLRKKQLARFDPGILDALRNLPGMPREFRYMDLKKATNNFDEKNKLGQGGYGVVYKGVFPKEDLVVAVKRFSRESINGKDDFLAELTIINRLRHRHLVRLLG